MRVSALACQVASRLATVVRWGESRVHYNMQGQSQAGEPPPCPASPSRPARQFAVERPSRRRHLAMTAWVTLLMPVLRACLSFVSMTVWTVLFWYQNVVCMIWRLVVDMSLSAPVQAVRGTTRTNSLDALDFQERRQLIASSLSLTDFLHVGAKEVAAVAGQSDSPFCLSYNTSTAFLTIALRNLSFVQPMVQVYKFHA